MALRDHNPFPIDKFNGLYDRGDKDSTPLDHFQDCNNIEFIGDSSFGTRPGVSISQSVNSPLSNIKRIYNFPTQQGNTLIILAYDYNSDQGSIYHYVNPATIYGPLLTITGMKDFAFLPYDGRGYISPFSTNLPVLNPPAALTALAVSGTGVEVGTHGYAVTFLDVHGNETTPGGRTTAISSAGIADPILAPIATLSGTGTGNNLVVGGTYKWKFAYQLAGGQHTNLGPVSNTLTITSNALDAGISTPSAFPAGATLVGIYRTTNGGSTYFQEQAPTFAGNIPISPAGYINLGILNDADLVTQPAAPSSNNTVTEQIDLSSIVTGGVGVTKRKVYRTEANLSQLKLLTTLNDNTTTVFVDTTPDASLGANAPTTNTFVIGDVPITIGLPSEFLYVYLGDGTAARKAAGSGLAGSMTIGFGNPAPTDAGFHIFGIVSETNTGYLSPPAALKSFTLNGSNSVSFGTIPTSGDPNVVKRHLVASIAIPTFNGNLEGYTLYFVPNATINNNSDTFLNNVSFFDADLLDDASHLFDNYTEIPAGAVLSLYNNRLCLFATATDISLGLISAIGEPEAISQIDGLIIVPPDGNPITNAQELRNLLYVTKRSKTVSFSDNGDVPSSWPLDTIDNALGSFVHGFATVLDSGSTSIDYLLICTYQGISLFNGRYIAPELTWKIEHFWRNLDRDAFDSLQILNDPVEKIIYIVLPNRGMLIGDYKNGLDPKAIRWAPWSFLMGVNTVAIFDISTVILGADLVV